LRGRFPTVEDLRRRARRRVPRFGFEYVDGGAGTDGNVRRNAAALEAVEIVPRYGADVETVSTEVELFGRKYAAPIGVAPMGLPSLIWPGAESFLAVAAQQARIPYILSTVAGLAIERAAVLAPDVFWFQLYRVPNDDHAIGFDLVRRADNAGAHVLVVTVDVPARSKRPRELRNRLVVPFRPTLSGMIGVAASPGWLGALLKNGTPHFANFLPYLHGKSSGGEVAGFVQREVRGGFTWEEIARIRNVWTGPLVLKGLMHPADAVRAVGIGIDGIIVSNHGGRQLEAAPAAIDVLPAVAAEVGSRMTVMMDSGVRCGLDVIRAVALGAASTFAGRPFAFGLGALGEEGAGYVAGMLIEEVEAALRQLGVRSVAEAKTLVARHPGMFEFPLRNTN
jgi:L-lactate dehydrogenase (cytochrome)